MTDETEVQEQVQAQEDTSSQITQDQIAEAGNMVEEQPRNDPNSHNWKEVHNVLKMQKQQIEELNYRLMEKEKPPQPIEKDEFDDLDPEDTITVDKARKMAEKIADKKAKESAQKYVQEYAQQQTLKNDEDRMRSKVEDYDYVIENFVLPMIKNDPALAYKIQQSKNPAETAYKLGRISDEYEGATMKQQTSPKAEKVLKNTSRPVSGNAVGSPLKKQADDFSKMSQTEIWNLSQKYARGA
jgi:hypothetical protein